MRILNSCFCLFFLGVILENQTALKSAKQKYFWVKKFQKCIFLIFFSQVKKFQKTKNCFRLLLFLVSEAARLATAIEIFDRLALRNYAKEILVEQGKNL